MKELAKAGANHPKNEEENEWKNEEDTNTVQVDLLVRTRRRVHPKKPRTQETLTPDQLCNAQQKKRINKKQPTFEEGRKGLPSKSH